MSTKIKALTIKVHPKTELQGVQFAWDKIPQLEVFTKNIIIPEIAVEQDGGAAVNIGTLVSGIPTVFARAALFESALKNIIDKNAEAAGLMLFYKSLVSEWKGFISCIALNYKDIEVNRVPLAYSDGKKLNDTENIYEPTGAFGNALFERQPLWCDQSLGGNAEKVPFIDVISFKGSVVGGTSPDCFLFTSVSYNIKGRYPFVNIQSGRFVDPLKSDLRQEELRIIYGYTRHILNNIQQFAQHFSGLPADIRPSYENISACLQDWMKDMVKYQEQRNYARLDDHTPPEVGSLFAAPFSKLFNYSTLLFGSEGIITQGSSSEYSIPFDPKDLLLPDSTEIAQIDFGKAGAETRNYLSDKPILLLSAETKGHPNNFAYFALPLTPLALNVFGANLDALTGLAPASNVRSRITALYDPNDRDGEKLIVHLKLFTETGNEIVKQVVYKVMQEPIIGRDILLWPNYVSKQWNRYFLFSEIPHNDAKFQATPFIGNVNDDFFRIALDEKGMPLYLAQKGRAVSGPGVKVQLHVASNNAVADNKYKYEIYESNQPFKGIKFSHAGVDCGFGIIRYKTFGDNPAFPWNMLNTTKSLSPAFLGIDFGSTNSSIAYYSDSDKMVKEDLKLSSKRISLLSSDLKDNNEHPAVENEIFFFQNDEVFSNSIKSVLTIHDSRRIVNEKGSQLDFLLAQAVKGGFPCFEKNLPIDSALDNRYFLTYNKVGKAELVYNMKWSSQRVDKSYKTAYLSSLMLHVYAELFLQNHEPHTLKWSYPSSMGKDMLNEYRAIWDSLVDISPINNGVSLKIYPPSDLSDIPDTSGGTWNEESGDGSSWDIVEETRWGSDVDTKKKKVMEIPFDTAPIRFDFKPLGNRESLSEACAVANYLVRPNGGYSINAGELVLCFDIGGSTTDITALCQMSGGKAMIKQNSIRFAAERMAQATRYSPNFRTVLLKMCERKGISIQGLNKGENKFSENTAPYYFEQVLDRLEQTDFNTFYLLIAAECKEMMSVNLYITGLIMFYAGQLVYKLRTEIVRSEDAAPAVKNTLPKVKIAFAGKGARIFEWFNAVDPSAANTYYTQMFIRGIGGEPVARKTIMPVSQSPLKIIDINSHKGESYNDVKYEVSKGLAIPTDITQILVPANKQAIEILGEEHFCIVMPNGEFRYLESTNSITPEMLEHIGDYFINYPPQGSKPCPRFMDFADLFYKVASSMFGLKMSSADFMAGFHDMNIENYIKSIPEFIEAKKRKLDEQKKFDYVAPVIILEGMKFFEKHLLKGIKIQ